MYYVWVCMHVCIYIRPGVHPASYTMDTGSFPGVKRLGRGVDHPPPSSAEVEGRVELYICSPSGPSWPVLGWILPFTLCIYICPSKPTKKRVTNTRLRPEWHNCEYLITRKYWMHGESTLTKSNRSSVKASLAFYRTRVFIKVHATAGHFYLSLARWLLKY